MNAVEPLTVLIMVVVWTLVCLAVVIYGIKVQDNQRRLIAMLLDEPKIVVEPFVVTQRGDAA